MNIGKMPFWRRNKVQDRIFVQDRHAKERHSPLVLLHVLYNALAALDILHGWFSRAKCCGFFRLLSSRHCKCIETCQDERKCCSSLLSSSLMLGLVQV